MDAFTAALGPEAAEQLWFWDESHWPHPVTPLTATLELPAMAEGFSRVCRSLRRAIPGYAIRALHGFVYMGLALERNAGVRAAQQASAEQALTPHIAGLMRYWEEEALPEVLAGIERLRETRWDQLADTTLANALPEMATLRARHWELHDLVIVPAMAAQERFTTHYARLFPGDAPSAATALLRGWPNKSTESTTLLWRLAHEPAVRGWLIEGGAPPPAWLAYLEMYGRRSEGLELADPAFHERPAPLLARLERYARGGHPDPEAALIAAAVERERLIAAALARLPDAGERAAFAGALAAARAYPILSEDHNFYIDQMALVTLRLPLLAMGRRLAARGLLAVADDVFFLECEELEQALRNPSAPPMQPLTTARRAERARSWGQRPPATLGTPLPPEMAGDPVYGGFFGLAAEPDAGGATIQGTPGAPGVAAGPARVARTLAEADTLQPGEVLVAPMTTPAWTPLFATAAAVVAGSGGALSHTAIVAREYGIPCVAGARTAPLRIRTGQWLIVDGSRGTVTIG